MAPVIALLVALVLPTHLQPPAPFPGIVRDAPTFTRVAPGVNFAQYDLDTLGGPMIVRVVAIDAHRTNDVRIDTVLAHDALTSAGERVTDMAQRTGAVAGINGDYFDPATNRTTNIAVVRGRLLAMPRKRYALVLSRTGDAHFVEASFLGQVQLADRAVPLDLVNEMPAASQVALLTPEYGAVAARDNLTLVALQPGGGTPFGTYRVTAIADNTRESPPGYYLAIGMDAYARTGVPNAGDTIEASGDLSPLGLGTMTAAIGGGPLLLRDGAPYDDPDGPTGSEYNARNPSSAVALTADGTLLLIEVDGRDPLTSIGITRAEMTALMRALGARDGMALDGGGSSAIAVRRPGQRDPSLENAPSDGFERAVSNGLFVYSTAPVGAPARIVALPQAIHALVGATVPVRPAIVDAAEHVTSRSGAIVASVSPVALGTYANGAFVARTAGSGVLRFRSGALSGEIPIVVAHAPVRVVILPLLAHVAVNGTIQLHARAYDDAGYPLAVAEHLPWSTSSGSIDSTGTLVARDDDANVRVTIGGRTADGRVLVGSKERALPFESVAHFASVPRGGAGSAVRDPSCACIQLSFALGPDERAAYAMADLPLPAHTIAVAFDVRDDGSGAHLRLALRNGLGAQVLVNGVTLDHPGWRHLQLSLPATVMEPAKLSALYVIGPKASSVLAGSIVIRNVHAVVAGSQ